jgi:hypothetical protein
MAVRLATVRAPTVSRRIQIDKARNTAPPRASGIAQISNDARCTLPRLRHSQLEGSGGAPERCRVGNACQCIEGRWMRPASVVRKPHALK